MAGLGARRIELLDLIEEKARVRPPFRSSWVGDTSQLGVLCVAPFKDLLPTGVRRVGEALLGVRDGCQCQDQQPGSA